MLVMGMKGCLVNNFHFGLPHAGTDYVLNASQRGILSWLICGHSCHKGSRNLGYKENCVYAKLVLERLTKFGPLLLLEYGASLKLKYSGL